MLFANPRPNGRSNHQGQAQFARPDSYDARPMLRAKEPMHLNTNLISSASHILSVPFKPKQQKPVGTLSRRELQRIVAEMLG
jgi:hypothetical protein